MAREVSAGGVVLRRMKGGWWVAVIYPRRSNDDRVTRAARRRGTILALPKGTVDPGERPEQTAVREIREEAGIDVERVSKLGDIRYIYVRSWGDRQRVFKVVSFYLFLYRSGRLGDVPANMQHEVEGAVWLPLEEAARRMSYRGERDMVREAQKYLDAHPELADARVGARAASETP
jgi:8-oxo-dGTP pyrophosphatase MutT (NUDIX family)